ncbi:methyltransferase domain-containing protein [Aequorivita sp. SDUM287046]|uniref:Methyltransferase domain-containing protein n=1 Tax=Aequorivita aurantiaca TaxID=3053356 RepID=A0ABT8DJ73_9FLAO|nr:class I SAM-dependent methyltransferase [Aequorivita aurantiaca]MDN3724039.1 methyltransferase domain-containing protein [Aequorivita aurantiaca]
MKKSSKLRNIWYSLSSNQRFFIRRVYYLPKDTMDTLTGKRHKYVPPRGYIYTGSPASAEDYLKQGQHQVNMLKEYAKLQPGHAILDIGSGIGRTAIALTDYINESGSYEGFDVVERGVQWCNSRIHKEYPNFNFQYVPLFNDLYNTAKLKATEFIFPYADNSIDVAFSFSVFTHMQIEEIQHYFNQIHRILKPGGVCLSTFFLYDDTSEELISGNKSFSFPMKKENYRLMNDSVKSGNIAIHKNNLFRMLCEAHFEEVKIIEGFWKDEVRDIAKTEYQDMVIFRKTNSSS